MVMLNDLDRFHLVMDVIDRVPGLADRAGGFARRWWIGGWRRGPTPASTARTTPRSATGRGPADRGARPGPERRVELAQGVASWSPVSREPERATTESLGRWSQPRRYASVIARARQGDTGIDAVAHRVVHGGTRVPAAVVVDDRQWSDASRHWPSSRHCTTRRPLDVITEHAAASSGRAPRGVLRHGLPLDRAGGSVALPRACAWCANGASALRLPWPVRRVVGAVKQPACSIDRPRSCRSSSPTSAAAAR